MNDVVCALWRNRHPDLIPVVRRSLEQLTAPSPTVLHGLLALLEMSPDEFRAWAALRAGGAERQIINSLELLVQE